MSIKNKFPNVSPSLNLDFTNDGGFLDPRISFTRATSKTFLGSNGYIQTAAAGVWPVEYDINGVALGRRVDEQRTNLLLRSEDFTAWTGSTTITANAIAAPDGATTADLLTPTSSGSGRLTTVTFTGDGEKCASIFLKAGTSTLTKVALAESGVGSYHRVNVAWSSGVPTVTTDIGSGTIYPVEAFDNGWYRINFSAVGVIAASTNLLIVSPDTTGANGTVYAWGAQAEDATFPSPYIPTVASTVTRNADQASMTGTNFSSWFNGSEGTFFADVSRTVAISAFPSAAISVSLEASDGTTGDRISLVGVQSLNTERFAVTDGGSAEATIEAGTGVAAGVASRLAARYALNDFAASLNGAAAVTDTAGNLPTVDEVSIGWSNAFSGRYLNGTIKTIRYYPVALSDSLLQSITR